MQAHTHVLCSQHTSGCTGEAPAGLEHQGEAKVRRGCVRIGGASHAAEVCHWHARSRKVLLLQQLVLSPRPRADERPSEAAVCKGLFAMCLRDISHGAVVSHAALHNATVSRPLQSMSG